MDFVEALKPVIVLTFSWFCTASLTVARIFMWFQWYKAVSILILVATNLIFFLQSIVGKKRSELKHLIKERSKKLDEIKQSIKVIKVSRLVENYLGIKILPLSYCVLFEPG